MQNDSWRESAGGPGLERESFFSAACDSAKSVKLMRSIGEAFFSTERGLDAP